MAKGFKEALENASKKMKGKGKKVTKKPVAKKGKAPVTKGKAAAKGAPAGKEKRMSLPMKGIPARGGMPVPTPSGAPIDEELELKKKLMKG